MPDDYEVEVATAAEILNDLDVEGERFFILDGWCDPRRMPTEELKFKAQDVLYAQDALDEALNNLERALEKEDNANKG